MSHQQLGTYLNDHLAGSVVAIRLMDGLHATLCERDATAPLAALVAEVRREVEADRRVLEALIERVGSRESALRRTAGWFAERFAQAKMAADDDGEGTLRVLEAAEVVTLGILGKRALWRALRESVDGIPAARELDFDDLIARAESQHDRLDLLRLGAARAALTATRH